MINNYIKFGASIIVLLTFSAMGYQAGKVNTANKYIEKENIQQKQLIAYQKQIADKQLQLNNTINQLTLAREQKKIEVQTKYKTITKEVIKYVQTNPNDDVNVPLNWVFIHDSAARYDYVPNDADITRIINSTPTVKLSRIIGVVIDNYQLCNDEIDKLRALQEEVKKNMEVINK